MKRGTPGHPKTRDLMQRLGVSLPETCGVLELLWHFTAAYAPAGDVGQYTDQAIADGIGWKGEPAKLIRELLAAHFLDPSADYRILVHNWSKHADDAVNMRLCRELRTFAEGTEPSDKRLSKKERAALKKKRTSCAHDMRTESALPSPALPRPLDNNHPPQTPPARAGGARSKAAAAAIADRYAALYLAEVEEPAPSDRVRLWRQQLRRGTPEAEIVAWIEAAAGKKRERDEQLEAARRWREQEPAANAWIKSRGGKGTAAAGVVAWLERNRKPGETLDQALQRWGEEVPPGVVGVLYASILLRLERESRSPPAEPKPERGAA